MAVKVPTIYYSATGTTYRLPRAVEDGASEAGVDVRLRKVRELAPQDDALVFAAPTRYGLPTAELKQFFDTTGPLWAKGALVKKKCSASTSSGTAHGGQETTMANVNTTFYHWGAIIVGPGYAGPIQFKAGNRYGASFTSNNGGLTPEETALASARFQGRRVAELAAQCIAGRKRA
jgi:NAD(P)H dehydrogenase (quinone)